MKSTGITDEEKVLKVRQACVTCHIARANFAKCTYKASSVIDLFQSCYFICRKRSSPEFQASAVWSHGKRFWNRCRSQRLYELDELLQ